jgi:hypothetical protein
MAEGANASDARVLRSVLLLLSIVAAAICVLPRRALSVDPIHALGGL